jgi:hypothetical protein
MLRGEYTVSKQKYILGFLVLLALVFACSYPPATPVVLPPTLTPVNGTAMFQTVQAQVIATLTAEASQTPARPVTTSTPDATLTATLTPLPTSTITPIFTATPIVPIISVSVDTNCRSGPGKIYDFVGALLVGETAEVVGRDPSGEFWYVPNPDQPGEYCWLYGKYATLAGNTLTLPVFTPPPTPTPTPDFELSFTKVDSCTGWYITFSIKNNGGVAFESVYVYLKDTDAPAETTATYDVFERWNGCSVASSVNGLEPGESGHTNSGLLAADPTGHKIKASIKLCTLDGLAGMCVTKNLTFRP